MLALCVICCVLLAIPAAAADLTFPTTAEEDAALAIATKQFNASRRDRPALTTEQYFREYVRSMLGSLQIRVQHDQEKRKEAKFQDLSVTERQRILNQMQCQKDTCP